MPFLNPSKEVVMVKAQPAKETHLPWGIPGLYLFEVEVPETPPSFKILKSKFREVPGIFDRGRFPDRSLTHFRIGDHSKAPPASSKKVTLVLKVFFDNPNEEDNYRWGRELGLLPVVEDELLAFARDKRVRDALSKYRSLRVPAIGTGVTLQEERGHHHHRLGVTIDEGSFDLMERHIDVGLTTRWQAGLYVIDP